jgi:predicted xylose isomerase-like sugar epimerase
MSNGSEESRRVPRIETAHVKVKALGRITKERLYFDVAGVYGSLGFARKSHRSHLRSHRITRASGFEPVFTVRHALS